VVNKIKACLGVTDLGPGGTSTFEREALEDLTLNEVAIIFRLRRQGLELIKALDEAGLAWQMCGEEEISAIDELDFQSDKISLLTMHAAKGLEFKLVFVVGLEEGLCPLDNGLFYSSRESDKEAIDNLTANSPSESFFVSCEERLAEERRLFYVALTRAKDLAYLTRATSRFLYGQRLEKGASRFWDLIPSKLCYDHQAKHRPHYQVKESRLF
jgi:superfamily I DNA/RNA helicase